MREKKRKGRPSQTINGIASRFLFYLGLAYEHEKVKFPLALPPPLLPPPLTFTQPVPPLEVHTHTASQ